MSEYDLHSFILACDFRVDDVDTMWKWLKTHRDALSAIGAHHVVLYESIWEPHRVLVTIGVRHAHSIRDVLASPAIFEWFNISGADDIPPIFGGVVVEKIDLCGESPADQIGRVVVGVMSSVDDVSRLMVKVHDGLERFRSGGVRKIWVYRALDDGQEVLILQEIDDEASARQWIDNPDAAAEWMSHAGMGAYPNRFVGRFAHLMSVGEPGQRGPEMFVCLCTGTTSHVVNEVVSQGARTSKQIADACGAGGDCGRCRRTLRAIIEAHYRDVACTPEDAVRR